MTNPVERADDRIVFLLDVDNTLLDNDRFAADISERLELEFGAAGRDRYWALYALRREQLGFADYLGTLEAFRVGCDLEPQLLRMSSALLNYPFHRNLYPEALAVISRLHSSGQPVIFSDGDIVFQPHKIHRAGLWDAVQGRVVVSVHKEKALESMRRAYPARHYVMVDDKPGLLASIKQGLGTDVTTVFVRQGHYAREAEGVRLHPPPDRVIHTIAELIGQKFSEAS